MKKIKSPISVQYEITDACNNRCKHCYNSFRFNGGTVINDPSVIGRIVDEIIASEIFHAVITGGEPFLAGDALYGAISKLTNHGVVVNLNSNLTEVNLTVARRLKTVGLKHVLTSVIHWDPKVHDRQTQREGAHKKTMFGISAVADVGIGVTANMVVSQSTSKDVYKTGKIVLDAGVTGFTATRVAPSADRRSLESTLSAEELESVFDQLLSLKEECGLRVTSLNPTPFCFSEHAERYRELIMRGCSGGTSSATISSDGFLRSCQHGQRTHSVSSILERDLADVWQEITSYKKEYLPKMCVSCTQRQTCGGGCRESAYVFFGAFNARDPLAKGPSFAFSPKELPQLSSREVHFYGDISYRKEEPGGVLFRSPKSWIFLNSSEFNLALSLAKLKKFNIDELVQVGDVAENVLTDFFNTLYNHQIIGEVFENGRTN